MAEVSVISSSLLVEHFVVTTPHRDWGSFYLRSWWNDRHDGRHYGGEIVANTSFGRYGSTWNACAVPFKQFLCGLDFDYFMTKATTSYKQFDFDGSLANIRAAVLEARRRGDIDRTPAAAIWEAFDRVRADGDNGAHAFVSDLYRIRDLRRVTQEPYEFAREKPTAECQGFWRELWPRLREKLQPVAAAVPA